MVRMFFKSDWRYASGAQHILFWMGMAILFAVQFSVDCLWCCNGRERSDHYANGIHDYQRSGRSELVDKVEIYTMRCHLWLILPIW